MFVYWSLPKEISCIEKPYLIKKENLNKSLPHTDEKDPILKEIFFVPNDYFLFKFVLTVAAFGYAIMSLSQYDATTERSERHHHQGINERTKRRDKTDKRQQPL